MNQIEISMQNCACIYTEIDLNRDEGAREKNNIANVWGQCVIDRCQVNKFHHLE